MKKKAIIVLCLALVLTLIGCGNNTQSSDEHKCEDGFCLSKQIWKILQQMCWLLRCLSKSF